jgi:hypothetical protein
VLDAISGTFAASQRRLRLGVRGPVEHAANLSVRPGRNFVDNHSIRERISALKRQ